MLKLIRGATQSIVVTIEDDKGELYKLKKGDVLKFGVKRNWRNTDYDICKEITNADEQGNGYIFSLAPEDTIDIEPGQGYYFDVGLQTAAGDFYIVIPCSSCVIMPAVTQKETIT